MVKNLKHLNVDRKSLIIQLIGTGKIHSQADVVRELKDLGLEVTQATASRDLQELGAVRSKDKKGVTRYSIPSLATVANNVYLILSANVSGNIVVIKTPPAAAAMLASQIDASITNGSLATAIGSVAGDDTVLVIASTPTGGKELSRKVMKLFGKEN